MVKEHGLNVYFDGDFSGHNPLWTDQFPENMELGNCRGVVAFIDDAYTKSYATLMELFNELFDKAVEAKILDKTIKPYKKSQKIIKDYLKSHVQLCVERFLVMLMLNDNVYSVGVTINDIVSTIKDVCGEEVVSDITANTDKGYS